MLVVLLFVFASVSFACKEDLTEYSRNSCEIPENVKSFNKFFADEIKDCEQLNSVLNGVSNVTREEMKSAFFYAFSAISFEAGYEKPTEHALEIIKGIIPDCFKLRSERFLSIYSTTVGKRLNEEKKLCPANAQILASTFARINKDVARKTAGENCPRSKILSLIMSLCDFLEAQDLYQGDEIGKLPRVSRNERECQSKVGRQSKNCPIAWYSPEEPASESINNTCKMQDKAIDIFVSAFHKQVKNCKILSNLFNIQRTVSPAMFSRGTYYLALYYLAKNGVPEARALSDVHSRSVRDVKNLKPCLVEGVHSAFVAKFLLSDGILNEENAEKLAEMFAKLMKDRAAKIVDSRDDRSKVVAIQISWRKFMKALKISEGVDKLASFYGNEWRCQA